MNKNKEIKLIVQLKTRFVSTNSLYKARVNYVGGRPIGVVYKNPKAVEVEREIREQLRTIDFSDYIDWLRNTPGFKLHIQFIFKKNVLNSDTSNYFKNLEDIWTRFVKEDLGIETYDDRLHIEISAVKSVIPKSKHEYACISLKESKFNMRLDKEEKPNKIFVECEDDFKSSINDILKKKKINFFIPNLENDDINIINKERYELCNTILYIFTPNFRKIRNVAKLIDSTWECLSNGSGFIIIYTVNIDDWDENSKEELNETINLINNISQGNSRIKIKNIKSIEDIEDI